MIETAQLRNWLGLVSTVDSNDFYRSVGCTSEQLTRYLNLCRFFLVPMWYMQDLKIQNGTLYFIDQFSEEPVPNLFGLAFADNVVGDVKSVIDFVESVPSILYNTVVMTEEDKEKYGKHFFMAETCIVESKTYEDYLQKFDSKKRYGFRKAKALCDSPEFMQGTEYFDVSYSENSTLDGYLKDSGFCDLVTRLLMQTSRKWFTENIYHAQASLLWAISVGGRLVYNNSEFGEAGQFLVKRNNQWHNGFFTCNSKHSLYLKAFLLDCLDRSTWSNGSPYFTTSHSTAYDIFDADASSYAAYKLQIADAKRPCGLIASVASLDEKPDYLTPPYYVLDTKTWVFE